MGCLAGVVWKMISKITNYISENVSNLVPEIRLTRLASEWKVLLYFYTKDGREFSFWFKKFPDVVGPLYVIEYETLGWDAPESCIYDQGQNKIITYGKSLEDVLTDLRDQIAYAETQYKEIMEGLR